MNNTTKLLINALADGKAVAMPDIVFDTGLSYQLISHQFKSNTDLFIQTRKAFGRNPSVHKLSEKGKIVQKQINTHCINENLRMFHDLMPVLKQL